MPDSARPFAHPLLLAFVLTLTNAVKPVVIDDTAYLLFARQIAQHPFDPYGFELFWYDKPEPAMTILLPPVVPYWLALGIALFGEQIFLLKLWLFPFAALLAYSARFLLRRFASRFPPQALAILVVGPGVLPFFNFMLDVPALALQLAAIALFLRGIEKGRDWRVLAVAGVCLGLAVQTKYSVLGLPMVLMSMGWFRHRWREAIAVIAVGVTVFLAWEGALLAKYDQSHFWHHVARKAASDSPSLLEKVGEVFNNKVVLVVPLLSHLGLTVGWIGLLGLLWRYSSRVAGTVAVVVLVLFMMVVFIPGRWNVLIPNSKPGGDPLTLAALLFPILGGLALGVGIRFAILSILKQRFVLRRGWESRFLLGWLAVELCAYFALTPFPAGRRVIGLSFVLALIALRVWVRLVRLDGRLRCGNWIFSAGLILGIVAAAVDCWDGQPERVIPQRAAAFARERDWGGSGYFVGHWGFQYYAGREGMTPIEPGRTRLRPGDWLVLPIYPDDVGFYRPHHGEADIERNADVLKLELELVWDDYLYAQTIPNLYGGRTPVTSRFHPRLRIGIYRVIADWVPNRAKP